MIEPLNKFTIQLGALAPSLKSQLKPFKFPHLVVQRWQRISDAISILRVQGYIRSETVIERMRQKLIKEIQKAITNKEKR